MIGPMGPQHDLEAVPIGRMIRRFRMAYGWTQIELGQVVGVEQSTISRMENETGGEVSLSLLIRMSRAFRVWPSTLLGETAGTLSMLRARVALHGLYLGYWGRGAELVRSVLWDLVQFRPDMTEVAIAVMTSNTTPPILMWAGRRSGETAATGDIEASSRYVSTDPIPGIGGPDDARIIEAFASSSVGLMERDGDELRVVSARTVVCCRFKPEPDGLERPLMHALSEVVDTIALLMDERRRSRREEEGWRDRLVRIENRLKALEVEADLSLS